jgi:hypothetical protein
MAAGDPGVLKRNFSATAIQTTLVNSISSAATGDTTTSVAVVSVSGFPSTVPYTLILDPDGSKEEVVTVTAASSTTLTITRGQDNTPAVAHAAGTSVRHGVSGRDFKEEQTHIAARGYDADTAILSSAGQTHVHGLQTGDGSVVGSDQLVTLTRKTLTTPVINGATLTGTVTSTASIVISGSGTITGLSSAGMVASSAAPKNYVDSILGSATAASTSAASAATSATSAATSATSAATSATSSASSASAAATSASSALTSQTAAATSATSAAASATAAATSATSAATSASSALTSQTAAATSATSAATSATSAAASVSTIATYASDALTSANSAATSAASAAASTSAAAASASAAATSATSASASQTAAATSATSAATSASSALTSQTAAATSATSAATSASSALTSQTAAATSATSAATSASSAATTYTNYDARYLGAKASAPSVDNQGGALITGATYFNSTTSIMYAWSGSAWQAISTTSSYSAPTLGSTTIGSGATVTNITGLTLTTSTVAADPTTSLGIASKQYVDTIATGINFHAPVVAASTTNLGVTYSNGSSGIGATLTADTNRAFNTLDGQSVSVGQRVLIKDQTAQLQNGIYSLTNNGSGAAPWVLTRTTDQDAPGEMANGDVIFTIGGTVNSGKTFVNSTVGTITVGTTAIVYSAYYTGLPAQTGNAGYYLTTDGTTPSWGTVAGYSAPTLGSTSIGSGATVTNVDNLTINSTTIPSTVTLVSTAATQTLTGKTISGASNTLSNIGNSSLTNSSITINGTSISLGDSATVGGGADEQMVVMGAF